MMFITEKEQIRRLSSKRHWQGIPSIEVTSKNRIFACWYSGGITEQKGNFSLLTVSDDGINFSEPIAIAYMGEQARAYDSCLWIDPKGRLWYFWAVMPDFRVEYVICNHPDAQELVWSDVHILGGDVMMNKPIASKNGDYLFPVAVWKDGLADGFGLGKSNKETGAYVYASSDEGKTFSKRGKVCAKNRHFDEHMLLEREDGSLEMYIRTSYGIAKAVSFDGGFTFGPDEKAFDGPNSRFSITRLKSGNILIVNHVDFSGRNNLTAVLYDSDFHELGKLLLDERSEVSYPDVKEKNGYIYIIYDRERGAKYRPDVDYSNYAREILLAKVTEQNIISGSAPEGSLKRIVNKIDNPF